MAKSYVHKRSKKFVSRNNSEEKTNNSSCSSKFAYFLAVTLSILEVKRLVLLVLQVILNLRALRFVGALKSLAISYVDVALGFPTALFAIYAIHKYDINFINNFSYFIQY